MKSQKSPIPHLGTNDKACLALAIIENRDLAMSMRSQLKRIITKNPSES
ncbi:MAG: hypothetical protein LW850_18220 [Planctomycetaceae bacterium]|nr:hypothetical protein [Planctomycetaceae bacterium]MCE2812326.1 hypothetical protein [Planctomycetaceae bacterium]